jgi:hypothetical protein
MGMDSIFILTATKAVVLPTLVGKRRECLHQESLPREAEAKLSM